MKHALQQIGQFMNCSKVFMREMNVGRYNPSHLQQVWQQMGCSGKPDRGTVTDALRH
ncbi:hypothetical protein HBF24_00150 [Oleiagrimonas sp. C23AA]|nr:hypothetical protein [Oleiagrimonas sp. C23AA]